MAEPSFPLIEQAAGPVTIEQVGQTEDVVTFRITVPAPRVITFAGLVPLLTFPC